jgi:uncharacterized protein with GYD domain
MDAASYQWEALIVPIYISRGCYTADAVRGMMAKPEDREPSIASVFEKLGGKLLCYYVTLGEFDWLLIAEFPNEKVASSAILVAMAGGSVSNVQTTVAMTSKQAMEAFSGAAAAAQSFKSAGK